MNVGELINKLQEFDKTMTVVCFDKFDCDNECEWFTVETITSGIYSDEKVLFISAKLPD